MTTIGRAPVVKLLVPLCSNPVVDKTGGTARGGSNGCSFAASRDRPNGRSSSGATSYDRD